MDNDENTTVYFGIRDGIIKGVVVAEGGQEQDVADAVSQWICKGATIERGTVGEARRFYGEPWCHVAASRIPSPEAK